jgi:phosphoglycolate phosphatase
MVPQAIIFDLDGTLLNTLHDIALAANEILARYNLPLHSVADYRRFIGNGIPKLVERVLPTEVIEQGLYPTILAEVIKSYHRHSQQQTCLYSGIGELLTALNQLRIPLAILSNKAHEFMPEVINEYLASFEFALYLGARPNYPLKPDPSSALEIAMLLDVDPKQMFLVGDSEVDMHTAHAAQMIGVGVLWGFRDASVLSQSGAQHIIAEPLELLELIS